jgi:hypothetical protein
MMKATGPGVGARAFRQTAPPGGALSQSYGKETVDMSAPENIENNPMQSSRQPAGA